MADGDAVVGGGICIDGGSVYVDDVGEVRYPIDLTIAVGFTIEKIVGPPNWVIYPIHQSSTRLRLDA